MHPRSRAPTRPSIRRATRSASRLSPIKPAERCPHCNSKRLIKKGTRKKKLEDIPLYRCRSCGRTFSIGPRAIRNKTYPLPEILEAFTFSPLAHCAESDCIDLSVELIAPLQPGLTFVFEQGTQSIERHRRGPDRPKEGQRADAVLR
jgi:DNA-directed RNA polymerase subunit RPC12/RpoP